jgi:molecular chaperone DnaK
MATIGIDLGTTNSVAAIDLGDRQHVLLANPNDDVTTPSVVSFYDGRLLVGYEARNVAVRDPQNTIFSIKRLMGCSIDDTRVNEMRKRYPYDIVSAPEANDQGVRVVLNGVKRKPTEISTIILEKLIEDAGAALGETITHAVITVPAYFNEPQRLATREAGRNAGLVVKKLIDEPTAAAIAFGIQEIDEDHRLLVFDMGGGTLDISILEMGDGEFDVLDYVGDMWSGGDDFDLKIVEMIVEWVKKKYRVDPSRDRRFQAEAKREAERAKIDLTDAPDTEIYIPAIVPLVGGDRAGVDMTITRQQFEGAIKPQVDKAMELVDQIMADQNLLPEYISAVLLVGGSTYVPLVRGELEKRFGAEKLRDDVNPMYAVAQGASILAARLTTVECPYCGRKNPYEAEQCQYPDCQKSLSLGRAVGVDGLGSVNEKTPKSLGIGVVDDKDNLDVFSVIIPKGTDYPLVGMKRQFVMTSHKITVPVYEGEAPVASQNAYLGMVELSLPRDVRLDTPVYVKFGYDRSRVLTVRVEIEGRPDLDHETTLVRDRYIMGTGEHPDDTEWIANLKNVNAIIESILEEYDEYLDASQKNSLEDDLRRSRLALTEKDSSQGREIHNKMVTELSELGTASYLFLGERLRHSASPEVSSQIAALTFSLSEAYKQGDPRRMEDAKHGLDVLMQEIIRSHTGRGEIGGFGGLLREVGTTLAEEESRQQSSKRSDR